jgi:hypothetical protein
MKNRIKTLLAYSIICATPALAQNLEASSPAPIEGRRVTTAGGNGEYRIVDLRPGVYVVTFTHEGFRTCGRKGLH